MDTRIREIVTRGYTADPDEICEEYFEWLTYVVNIGKDHTELARMLHNREFYSICSNDQNRVDDGKMLRNIFRDETLYNNYASIDRPNCSVLEMLVALAIRMESILEDPNEGDRTVIWFWEILDNLGLSKYTNYNIKYGAGNPVTEINDIVDNLVERRYKRSGEGGLFPLKNATKDQRKVEIWYQLSSYLLENYVDKDEINA